MLLSQAQKKLRQWFRNHGWCVYNAYTGMGVCLETPIHEACNHTDGKYRWHEEYIAGFEIDCRNKGTVGIQLFKNIKFTQGPNFEKRNKPWSYEPVAYIELTRAEIEKLAKLMNICVAEN